MAQFYSSFFGGGGGFCFLLNVCCLSLHCLCYWIICCPKGWQGTRLIGLLSPGMPSTVPRTSVFVRMNGPDSKQLLRGAERERSHQAGVKQRWLPLIMRPAGGLKVHKTPYSSLHLRVTLHWPGDKNHRGWSSAAQLILLFPSSQFFQK